MLKAYRDGLDLHRLTASEILNKPVEDITSDERKLAKAVNFGLLFGSSAKGLQNYAKDSYGVDMTLEQARQAKQVFHETYRQISAWQQAAQRQAKQQGYVRTLGGRARFFTAQDNLDTKACNSIVQGTGADLLMLAVTHVQAGLDAAELDARFINFVHDELVLSVAQEALSDVETVVRDGMIKAFAELFPEAVYMHADLIEIKTGATYADVK